MRQPRLKAPESWDVAYYHCVSRIVGRQKVLDEEEKGQLVNLMRQFEMLAKVRIVTYCMMSNHFHLLVEVPARPKVAPSEAELLDHIGRCYGKGRAQFVEEEIRQFRAAGAEEMAQGVIEGWLSRMWDISAFMKGFKQSFSQWFNKRHERVGTLWEDRYRSTIVQGENAALAMVGAYIDLNPVRAGIVDDPKDYLWSGYGAAVSGVKLAVRGVETMVACMGTEKGPPKGRQALEKYRVTLYGVADEGHEGLQAARKEAGARRGVPHDDAEAVRKEGGRLSRWEMLRKRVRYFTAGVVIGSREFVDEVFEARRDKFGASRKDGARPMRGADFGGLCALRDLRLKVIT